MVGVIGLTDPQMRVVFYQRVTGVEELEHPEETVFCTLFDLVGVHYVGVLWTDLPEETEFDDG